MTGGWLGERWAAGDTWGRRRHLGKSRRPHPCRRPSVYRASSSSVRRRWFFPKIASRTPGTSAHGIVMNRMKFRGASTTKSARRSGHRPRRRGGRCRRSSRCPASASGSGSWRVCTRTCSTATRWRRCPARSKGGQGRGVVHLVHAPPAAGKQDGADQLNPLALKPVADKRVDQVDGGGDHPGPGKKGEEEAGAVAAGEGMNKRAWLTPPYTMPP